MGVIAVIIPFSRSAEVFTGVARETVSKYYVLSVFDIDEDMQPWSRCIHRGFLVFFSISRLLTDVIPGIIYCSFDLINSLRSCSSAMRIFY